MKKTPIEERFWTKVEKTDSCWNWKAAVGSHGYGAIYFSGKMALSHRISWQLINGSIPDGLTLDHLCRNIKCVNPAHLEPVTAGENVLRGISLAALNARKTHCKRGHALSGENLYRDRNGRRCNTCYAVSSERFRKNNQDIIRENSRKYYVENRDRILVNRRIRYEKSKAPQFA